MSKGKDKIANDVKSKEKNDNKKTKEVKKEKPKKKRRIGLKIFLCLLLLLCIAAGVFAYKVYQNGGGISGIIATTLGADSETHKNLPTIYCVLFGESQNLTDTILVLGYNPKTQEASLLSIPRDTYTGSSIANASAYYKINALYQQSPEKAVKAISKVTGLDLEYYITVDTKAWIQLVDAIGGVYFDVPIDMLYDDPTQNLHINLKAGYQKLDGAHAEQVVRFRHNNNGTTYPAEYGMEDLGRMRTQRAFLTELAKQTLKLENVFKLGEIIDIAKNYVETNMDFETIKNYIPYAVSFNTANLKTETLPGESVLSNGVWIYAANQTKTKKVVTELFELKTESNGITIQILNGTGDSEKLTELVEILETCGYKVEKTDSTTATSKTTIINRSGKDEETSEALKNDIGIGVVTTGENNAGVDFTIILGKDYE